ncbi:MAG: extracellular solute-binding protein [Spirochaetales bacterium]
MNIRFFAPDTDAYVSSVLTHLAEFEAQTGHRVIPQIISSDEYFSNDIHRYLQGPDAADVYMSGPVLLWEHLKDGFVEPLDGYLGGASAEFRFGDFFDTLLRANRWTGHFGDRLGSGPLLALPVNCESYNLVYLPEELRRLGLEVPQNWNDYFAVAKKIAATSSAGVRGFGQRGVDIWHTMYTGYATQFWSYGATDFDASGRCVIDSAAGIHATEDFIDALRVGGPPDWTNQRWYELALDAARGQYGLLVDSDHYVAFFEDPKFSTRVGTLGYALPPAGPTGERTPNQWTWSLVMNAKSKQKAAAWEFLEWAAGAPFLLRSAFEGNMNPTRASVWDSAEFKTLTKAWGNFVPVSRELAQVRGKVLVTPARNYRRVAARWTEALREAYLGTDTVAGALHRAAHDIDSLVDRG